MTDKTTYVSEEGLAKLKQELEYLKTTKRKEISHRIASAKELGDLSENAEYSDAKEEQALLESRILVVEETLRHVEVIVKPKKSSVVVIGSKITVTDQANMTTVFEIVGSNESSPTEGKISNESPIGKAFLGHKVGEVVGITVPRGTTSYTINKIS